MTSRKRDWGRSPLPTVASGILIFGIGVYWIAAGGETPTGVFFLLIAALCVLMGFADAAIRRRVRGDKRSLLEQPVFRYQGLIFAAASVPFVLVALWSRRVGGEAVMSEIGGFLLGGFLAIGSLVSALAYALHRRGK